MAVRGRRTPATEKALPHDIEAEKSVIASLLVDESAIEKVVPILTPEDFHRDEHRWAFEAALALRERAERIDQITVAHELARHEQVEDVGGIAYLSQLITDLPTAIGVEHYARLVKRDAVARRLISDAAELTQVAWSANGNIGDVIAKAEERLARIREAAAPVLAGNAGPAALSLDEVLIDAHGAPEWLVNGLIPAGGLTILSGNPETAKSWLVMDLALALATGQPWLGRGVRRGPVLVVDEDNDLGLYGERFPGLLRGRGIVEKIDGLHFLVNTGIDLSTDEGLAQLEAEVRAFEPMAVIMETLALLRGRLDENDSTAMADLARRLHYLRRLNGHAQIITHHLAKPSKFPRDLLRGSSQLRAAADSILEVVAAVPDVSFRIRHSKSRRARRQPEFSFTLEEREGATTVSALPPSEARVSLETRARELVDSILGDDEAHARSDLLSACLDAFPGATKITVERELRRALGVLQAEGRCDKLLVGKHVYLRRRKTILEPAE